MSAYRVTQEEILAISGVDPKKCMRCGKCSATCPAYDEMEYHPHEFVAMVENGEIEALAESKSLYLCMTCMACIQRCPRQVEPAKLVEAVRAAVVRQKERTPLLPGALLAMVDADLPQQAIVSAMRKYTR